MILIVDDKQENLFSLKALLQLHAYEVDTALLGEEALKKTLKNEYALIILDVQMPGMDGYEVAETITGYSKTKDIPIIFLSAVNVDKRFITRGYASGGVDYITKPFDPDLLMLKVKTFCRLYDQTRALKQAQENLKEEIEQRRGAQQALEALNEQLEDIVAERTAALLRSNRELELSNIELQQYASIASHDLQEPLRKITMFSRMLLDKYLVGNPDAAVMAEKVVASTERMRNLINDLLNYSSLSSDASYRHTDLNEVLCETLADLEYSIVEKQARIKLGPLPEADVIPGQMRQLFQNLISNALKFCPPGCPPEVSIRGDVIAEKSPDAAPDPDGSFLRISVSDNGIGFDPSYTGKIFNLFQRLHLKTEYEGTGIGLAIAKKIVEKHNGLITARSAEGDGATFIVVLPLQQQAVLQSPTVLHAN